MKKGITSVLLVTILLISIPAVPAFADTTGTEPQQELLIEGQAAEESSATEETTDSHSIEKAVITLEEDSYVYTGSSILPVPKVAITDSEGVEVELDSQTQFNVIYQNSSGGEVATPVQPGTYQIVVEGKGDYIGTAAATASFSIEAYPVSNVTVTGIFGKEFTGRPLTQTPVVSRTVDGTVITLQEGVDYTVSYSNNTNVGTAKMTITGVGNYTGTEDFPFTIRGGAISKGWHRLNGDWYYYQETNRMLTNGWAEDSHGWCYMGSDGRILKSKWAKDSKGWCWLGSDGYWDKKSHWIKDAGEWYFLSSDGHMTVNAWVMDSNGWCYVGADGRLVRNGWAKDSHGWCWLGSSGRIVRGKWIQDRGDWYYLLSNGYMSTDAWGTDSVGYCYVGSDGRMIRSGWAKDSKGWCWLDASGHYNPGHWYKDNTGWYYIDGAGTRIKSKWMRDSKGWCWINSYGYYDSSKRYYQNPSWMIQISTNITSHGLDYYVSPLRVGIGSDRSDHIEAMIARAYDYLGDPYVVCQSRAPGKGVDCSGIVMQACYAAGIDLWPSNPQRHLSPAYEYESREIWKLKTLETVAWKDRQRGDLIFYANKYDTVIHIAIYLGNDKIIHSWPGTVRVSSVYGWGDHIKGVKRVFH